MVTHSYKEYIKVPEPFGRYPVIQQGDAPLAGFSNGTPFGNYAKVVLWGDHTVSLLKPEQPFFLATDGLKILSSSHIIRDYLYHLLINSKPSQQGYTRHYSILKEIMIKVPVELEQKKIGEFFSSLDNLITLHQRKCEYILLI